MKRIFRRRFFASQSDNLKSKIHNLKWLGLSATAFVLVVTGAVAQAQQPKKVPRIGYLSLGSGFRVNDEAFRQGLRELGYTEGQNIVVEWRFVDGKSERYRELNGKRLELLKEVVPKLIRVAVLGDRDHQNYKVQMKELEVAAQALGLQLQPVQLRVADDLENAFSTMARDRAGALLVLSNPAIGFFLGKLVEFATKGRLPGIYATPNWVTAAA